MSEYSVQRMPMAGRMKTTACALAAAAMLSMSFGAGSAVLAQDATPGATPAATCTAPALPPGAPSTPMAAASPAMDNMNMATPAAAASPTPPPAATPADEATSAAIVAAAENVVACGNSDNFEGLAALMTANFMEQNFQTTNPYDVVEGLKSNGGQHFGNFTTSNPVTYADGSVGIDVNYMQGQYQVVAEHWMLVKNGDTWMLDSLKTMTPTTDLDTAVMGVDLAGAKDAKTGKMTYSITPARFDATKGETDMPASPAIDLHGRNLLPGAENHEIVVLQLPAGATPADVFSGKVKESDVKFIGQVSVPSGTEADLLLVNLPAGEYWLACFVTGPDGQPHAMNGMTSKLVITPAS